MLINSFKSSLSEKFIISHSIVNDNLAGFSNLDTFFFFRTLNVSCHLYPQFLQRNQIALWGFLVYSLCFLSLAARTLSLLLF